MRRTLALWHARQNFGPPTVDRLLAQDGIARVYGRCCVPSTSTCASYASSTLTRCAVPEAGRKARSARS